MTILHQDLRFQGVITTGDELTAIREGGPEARKAPKLYIDCLCTNQRGGVVDGHGGSLASVAYAEVAPPRVEAVRRGGVVAFSGHANRFRRWLAPSSPLRP